MPRPLDEANMNIPAVQYPADKRSDAEQSPHEVRLRHEPSSEFPMEMYEPNSPASLRAQIAQLLNERTNILRVLTFLVDKYLEVVNQNRGFMIDQENPEHEFILIPEEDLANVGDHRLRIEEVPDADVIKIRTVK